MGVAVHAKEHIERVHERALPRAGPAQLDGLRELRVVLEPAEHPRPRERVRVRALEPRTDAGVEHVRVAVGAHAEEDGLELAHDAREGGEGGGDAALGGGVGMEELVHGGAHELESLDAAELDAS